MARRIDEQYHALSSKVLQLRKSTKVFDVQTEQALTMMERELETMTPDLPEGFNADKVELCFRGTAPGEIESSED